MSDHKNVLALRTYSNGQDWNADCDIAILPCSAELDALIADRQRMFSQLKGVDDLLISLDFWDHRIDVYSYCDELEHVIESPALDAGYLHCAELSVPDSARQRIEYSRMIVHADNVYWEFRPKHSDFTILETATVDITTADAAIEAAEVRS